MCYHYTTIAKPPFTKPPFVSSRVLDVAKKMRPAAPRAGRAFALHAGAQLLTGGLTESAIIIKVIIIIIIIVVIATLSLSLLLSSFWNTRLLQEAIVTSPVPSYTVSYHTTLCYVMVYDMLYIYIYTYSYISLYISLSLYI